MEHRRAKYTDPFQAARAAWRPQAFRAVVLRTLGRMCRETEDSPPNRRRPDFLVPLTTDWSFTGLCGNRPEMITSRLNDRTAPGLILRNNELAVSLRYPHGISVYFRSRIFVGSKWPRSEQCLQGKMHQEGRGSPCNPEYVPEGRARAQGKYAISLNSSLDMFRSTSILLLASAALTVVRTQGINDPQGVVNSWPHDYPGKPSGDFSPEWQEYFRVKGPLPNVTFDVARSFAGNVGVNRPGHPNNTLFFWAFEKENGSLTDPESTNEPWGIWLNGGPGSSSMLGVVFENGPIHINGDYSVSGNRFSWNTLADYFWIDQPVGTGWSTVDLQGLVRDEDELGRDFWGFVENIVKVFPNLKSRPLYLTGESYAGRYIPYITKTYFGLTDPPVQLAKIAIGDGTIGSDRTYLHLPTVSIIETFPQLISYDYEVFAYFKGQSDLCGYNLTLSYPQHGNFPTLDGPIPPLFAVAAQRVLPSRRTIFSKRELIGSIQKRASGHPGGLQRREEARLQWRRDLRDRANGTIDPFYGCAIYDELVDYALNFSLPWNLSDHTNGPDYNAFDVYNVPDGLNPESPLDAAPFLNTNVTRAAIHAPTVKDWVPTVETPFGTDDGWDPSVEPMAFLSELAANASERNIPIVIYSGNDDSLVAHFGTEVVIQNTTFGGIQGFTRKPSTPWFDDDGNVAGVVHQERGLTYLLFSKAGHQVPMSQPAQALTFLREYILGNNQTGLVQMSGNQVKVIGGEDSNFYVNNIVHGQDEIYVGSAVTQSTFTYPSATIAAWEEFIATATLTSSYQVTAS